MSTFPHLTLDHLRKEAKHHGQLAVEYIGKGSLYAGSARYEAELAARCAIAILERKTLRASK